MNDQLKKFKRSNPLTFDWIVLKMKKIITGSICAFVLVKVIVKISLGLPASICRGFVRFCTFLCKLLISICFPNYKITQKEYQARRITKKNDNCIECKITLSSTNLEGFAAHTQSEFEDGSYCRDKTRPLFQSNFKSNNQLKTDEEYRIAKASIVDFEAPIKADIDKHLNKQLFSFAAKPNPDLPRPLSRQTTTAWTAKPSQSEEKPGHEFPATEATGDRPDQGYTCPDVGAQAAPSATTMSTDWRAVGGSVLQSYSQDYPPKPDSRLSISSQPDARIGQPSDHIARWSDGGHAGQLESPPGPCPLDPQQTEEVAPLSHQHIRTVQEKGYQMLKVGPQIIPGAGKRSARDSVARQQKN
jgi:hypothetical protein